MSMPNPPRSGAEDNTPLTLKICDTPLKIYNTPRPPRELCWSNGGLGLQPELYNLV